MHVWRFLHALLSVVHTVVGVYVLVELEDKIEATRLDVYLTVPKVLVENDSYSVTNSDASEFKVSPIAIHAWVSILTGVSHFCSFLKYKKYGVCSQRPNVIRWVEYSITATLMTLSGLIALGEGNIFFLINIIILGVALQTCGYFIEKYVSDQATSDNSSFWGRYFLLGTAIEIAIVLPLIYLTNKASETSTIGIVEGTAFYSIYYSLFAVNAFVDAKFIVKMEIPDEPSSKPVNSFSSAGFIFPRYPHLFKGLVAGVAFGMIVGFPTRSLDSAAAIFAISATAVALTLMQSENYPEPEIYDKGFMITDERYAVLSFTSKMALFWITVASLIYNITEGDERRHWYGVLWAAMVVPMFCLVVFFLYQKNQKLFQDIGLNNGLCSTLFKSETRDFFNKYKRVRTMKTRSQSGIGSRLHF